MEFRRVLFRSITILSNIAKAMNPEGSTLLIEDLVLKDQGETDTNAEMDLLMMLLFDGKERTLQQWQSMLSKVSPPVSLVKVWSAENERQAILEVRREC